LPVSSGTQWQWQFNAAQPEHRHASFRRLDRRAAHAAGADLALVPGRRALGSQSANVTVVTARCEPSTSIVKPGARAAPGRGPGSGGPAAGFQVATAFQSAPRRAFRCRCPGGLLAYIMRTRPDHSTLARTPGPTGKQLRSESGRVFHRDRRASVTQAVSVTGNFLSWFSVPPGRRLGGGLGVAARVPGPENESYSVVRVWAGLGNDSRESWLVQSHYR
jgi:hypothetical protein